MLGESDLVTLGKKSNSLDIITQLQIVLASPKIFYQPFDHEPVNIYVIKVQMKHIYYFPLVDFIDRTLEKYEMWTVILRIFWILLIGAAYILALLTAQNDCLSFVRPWARLNSASHSFYFSFYYNGACGFPKARMLMCTLY